MNRRDFLKIGTVASAFGVIAASPFDKALAFDLGANINGKLYKAGSNGRVLVSSDKGKSWKLHTKFGTEYAVQNVFTATDQRLYAKMTYKKVNFYLVLSNDSQTWRVEAFTGQPKPKA